LNISLRQQLIGEGLGKLGNKAFGAKLCDADKHTSPFPVIDIEIVMEDPSIGDLQVPAIRSAMADGRYNAGRLACPENDHDRVRTCSSESSIGCSSAKPEPSPDEM
jgi:hypothetical protein